MFDSILKLAGVDTKKIEADLKAEASAKAEQGAKDAVAEEINGIVLLVGGIVFACALAGLTYYYVSEK